MAENLMIQSIRYLKAMINKNNTTIVFISANNRRLVIGTSVVVGSPRHLSILKDSHSAAWYMK